MLRLRQSNTASPAPRAIRARDRRSAPDWDALSERLRCEFQDVPGLSLTPPQVSRLFDVPLDVSQRVLSALASEGAIVMRRDGCFVRQLPHCPNCGKVEHITDERVYAGDTAANERYCRSCEYSWRPSRAIADVEYR